MSKKKSIKTDFSELRHVATEKLKTHGKKTSALANTEIEHELDVYKIELEMQNDELLNSQAKLLKSIEEYTDLFEYAPICYFILDINGIITKVNETGSEKFGASKKLLTGKHFSTFINHKSSQDRFYIYKNLTIETGKKQQFECKFKRQNGSLFYGLVQSINVKDEKDQFKYLFCTISDITIQKEQEQMLELALNKEKKLNEMKSQFITIASHEFRTPLSTILTSAELIEKYNKPEDNEKKQNHFHKITSSVNRLKEILIDFLSANEIERGEIKNNPKIFNLVDFTEQLVEETKPFSGIHSVKYTHLGENQNIYLDEKLLKTCMSNLIINAYKYSPNGGTIEITTNLKKPTNFIFTIKDEGIGIPQNNVLNIFTQFFRAKNAEHIQGTGIGLSITKNLVNLMDGDISFKTKENKGSTFTIKIPA